VEWLESDPTSADEAIWRYERPRQERGGAVTAAISLACVVVICAGAGMELWITRKAMTANREIYKIRRQQSETARQTGRPSVSGPVARSQAVRDHATITTPPILHGHGEEPGPGHLPGPPPPSSSGGSRWVRAVIAGYVALLVIGFLLGFILTTGSAPKRLGFGLVGLFGAAILVVVGVTAVRVGIAVRATLREKS
jgi:hypothetical protein